MDTDDLNTEVKRSGYHITRCCGNCKFYWYYKGNQRRGNCRLGSEYARTKATGQARTDHENKQRWPTTYSTCVCDFHIIKSRVWSVAKVTDYCGAKLEEF